MGAGTGNEAADGAVTGVRTQTGRLPAPGHSGDGRLSYPQPADRRRLPAAEASTYDHELRAFGAVGRKGHTCGAMQGLALKNVEVKLLDAKGKCVFSEFGELLFTHFGLSGPVILSASCHMQRGKEGYRIVMDLKPALDEKTLDARLLRDFAEFQNKDLSNALVKLLPHSMIVPVICRAGLQPQQKVNELTKQERRALLETVKQFSVDIASCAPVEQAIVTSGGVKVSEVSPKTMESKLVRGLYFAGELLDVDAYTGGFNLQIAWATGRLAGASAAQEG
ncbi:MAG: aminoacetone oxidase family FAD-binding enzyme [Oscillospiraceae bacterium]